jgi:hypothetical protein
MASCLLIRRHPRAFVVIRRLAHLLATGFAVGLMEGPDCLAALAHAGHARQPNSSGPIRNLSGVG